MTEQMIFFDFTFFQIPRKLTALISLSLFIAVPISLYFYLQNVLNVTPLPIGSYIPSVLFYDLRGNSILLDSIIHKKTIAIFFSTTCPHCKDEIQNISGYYPLVKDSIVIVGISLDNLEDTRKFIVYNQPSFPVYFDSTQAAKRQFRFLFIPAKFFINTQKRIVKFQIGEQKKELLFASIQEFVNGD